MKYAKNVDMVVNIVFIIFIALLAWAVGVCRFDGDKLIEGGGKIIEGIPKDGNAPGAGYELLGVLFAGGLSAFAGIALFFVAVFFGGIALVLLLMVIIAFCRRKKYKNTQDPIFIRRNLTAKMILCIIFVILVGTATLGNTIHIASVIYLMFLVGLLVLVITARKQTKS